VINNHIFTPLAFSGAPLSSTAYGAEASVPDKNAKHFCLEAFSQEKAS
jgi:hypothetical protein